MRKEGVLRRTTRIHTQSGLVFKVPKGNKVTARDRVLTFNPIEGVKVTKFQGRYFINLWGSIHLIVFPNDGRAPYPLSML